METEEGGGGVDPLPKYSDKLKLNVSLAKISSAVLFESTDSEISAPMSGSISYSNSELSSQNL